MLKWATVSLFAYVAVVFAVQVPLGPALHGALVPTFAFDGEHATALAAVLGTTISPYLFFWQAGQELHRRHLKALYWRAALNGVLAAPLMAVIMLLAGNPRVMGRLTVSRPLAAAGWAATAIMALVSLGLFVL